MPDLLPDIPGDLWNNWSAGQFSQAVSDKIAGLPGDIASGVQNALAPPDQTTDQSADLGQPPPPTPAPTDLASPQQGDVAPSPDFSQPPPDQPPTPAPDTSQQPQPASYDDLVSAGWSAVQGGAQQATQAVQQAPATAQDLLSQGWQTVSGVSSSAAANATQAAQQAPQSASDLLNQGWQVVSGGAPPPATPGDGGAVNTPDQASQAQAAARQSQFGLGLSSADAMAFCGPTAAIAFAQTYGRNPTVDEARQLAQQVGWNASQGMAGVGSEVSLLKDMGVDAHATQGVDWSQVQSSASSGNPVILDTPGHYYYVDGYNQQTGQYHVGTSGTDLKGGSEWMTPDQINKMPQSDGTVRAAVFADHPLGQGNPITDVLGQASQGLSSAASSAGQSASDLLNQGWQVVSGVSSSAAQGAVQNVQQATQSLGIQGPTPNTPGDLIDQTRQAAINAGIDPDIFARQIQQESGFDPNAKSGAGAVGIAQIMPSTAKGWGVDPTDPQAALAAAAQHMRQYLDQAGGNWATALSDYNAGPGNTPAGGVAPFAETQNYVNTILGGAKNVVQQGMQTAQQGAQQATQSAQDLASQGWQTVSGAADQTGQAALDAYNQATQQAQDLGNLLGTYTGDTSQAAQDLVSSAQQQGQSLSDLIQQAPDQAAQIIQQAASSGAGQTAQDLLSQAGAELTSPNLPSDVYQRSPTAWFNQQLASLGPDLTGATSLEDLMNLPTDARMAGGQALQNAGIPVLSGLLGSLLQAPSALDSAQTVSDLQQKYGQGVTFDDQGHLQISPVDTSLMTPEDRAAYNQATMAIGGLEAPEMPNVFGAGGTLPTTGAGLLQRAMDSLSQYPEEIAAPIRDFASSIQSGDAPAAASDVARTIQQWMLDNPLGSQSLPDVATATGAELRDAGQQAVADVADTLQQISRGGGGPTIPGGEQPGQISLFDPNRPVQSQLQPAAPGSGLGGLLQQITDPAFSAGDRQAYLEAQWARTQQGWSQMEQNLQDLGLIGDRTPGQAAGAAAQAQSIIPGFENMDWQAGLPEAIGGQGGLLDQILDPSFSAGDREAYLQAQWAKTQQGWADMQQHLQDLGLIGDRTGTTLPVNYERGAPASYLQNVLPGFNPRNPVSVGDWFNLLHTSAVTSALNTLTKVGMHTGLTPMWDAGAHAAYDTLTGNPGRVLGGGMGLMDALSEGGRNALLGIRDAYLDPSAISQRVDNPIAQNIARAVETPMNAHAALQGFNKEMTSSMEVSRLAGNAAWDQTGGLSGFLKNPGAFVDRYNELKANPLPGWQQAADAVGQRSALRGELGGWGQLINRVVKANDQGGQSTVGNLAWPVFRIGWNGAVQRVEKSPLGAAGTAWDVGRGLLPIQRGGGAVNARGEPLTGFGPYKGASLSDLIPALRNELTAGGNRVTSPFNQPVQAGVTPLAERVKNNVMGTATDLATMAIAAHLAHKGLDGTVTGNGPDDTATRDQLTAGGWLQNAIHLPGVGYVDASTVMPTGGETMNLIGNLMDAINYPSQTEVRNVQAGRAAGVPDWIYGLESLGGDPHANAHAAIDQSALRLVQHVGQNLGTDAGLRQIATVANALYGHTTGAQAATSALGSTLGGLVPYSGALRSLAQAGDVAQRQPQNVQQAIMQNLPGLRGQVPSRVGPTGQPEPNPRAGLGALSPVTTGASINDPTLGVLDQHGVTVPHQDAVATAPSGTAQASLSADEQRMVEMRRGYLIQQNVKSVTGGAGYQQASRDQQSAMLKRAVSMAGLQAEGEMISRIASQDRSRLEPAKKTIVTTPQPGPRPQITTP